MFKKTCSLAFINICLYLDQFFVLFIAPVPVFSLRIEQIAYSFRKGIDSFVRHFIKSKALRG